MSSNSTSIINNLNNISIYLNQYFGIFIFLFGSIGNILNILVLSQRSLRSNPCALFFLVSSISNLIAIQSGLTSRILSGWNMDLTANVLWLCKFRIFISFPSRTAAYWFILLATIDRWLLSSTNINRRQKSTLKNAQYSIVIVIILSIILYIHAPICYEISSSNVPLQCYGKTKTCRLSVDLMYGFITILLPILLMNIFSLMTIFNIRRRKNSIRPLCRLTNNQLTMRIECRHMKKTDQRLLLMLCTQIILFTILAFPIVIQRIYTTAMVNNQTSNLQAAIESFIFNFVLLLSFLAHGLPFYIYTLIGGKTFQKALFNVIRCIY